MAISFNTTLAIPDFTYNIGMLSQGTFTKIDGLPTKTDLHRETAAEALGRNLLRPAIDRIYSIANRLIPSFPVAYAQEMPPCESQIQKSIDEELRAHESALSPKEVRPNIFIAPSLVRTDFSTKVRELIDKIESNPVGAQLIRKLKESKDRVFINYSDKDMTRLIPVREPSGSSKIDLNFSLSNLRAISIQGEEISNPAYVRLVHDLIMATHFSSYGFAYSQNCDPLAWYSDEEYDAVIGLPSNKEAITENAFRKAEGLPERFGYLSPSQEKPLPLLRKRIKSLAKIHEKNLKNYPGVKKIAKRSRAEKLSGDVLLYAKVTIDPITASAPRAGALTTLYLPLDKEEGFSQLLQGDTYRILPVDLIESSLKQLLLEEFPHKLGNRQFQIVSSQLIQLDDHETRIARSIHESGG